MSVQFCLGAGSSQAIREVLVQYEAPAGVVHTETLVSAACLAPATPADKLDPSGEAAPAAAATGKEAPAAAGAEPGDPQQGTEQAPPRLPPPPLAAFAASLRRLQELAVQQSAAVCYLGGQGVQLVRGLQLSAPLTVRQLLSGEFDDEGVFKDTVQLAPASQGMTSQPAHAETSASMAWPGWASTPFSPGTTAAAQLPLDAPTAPGGSIGLSPGTGVPLGAPALAGISPLDLAAGAAQGAGGMVAAGEGGGGGSTPQPVSAGTGAGADGSVGSDQALLAQQLQQAQHTAGQGLADAALAQSLLAAAYAGVPLWGQLPAGAGSGPYTELLGLFQGPGASAGGQNGVHQQRKKHKTGSKQHARQQESAKGGKGGRGTKGGGKGGLTAAAASTKSQGAVEVGQEEVAELQGLYAAMADAAGPTTGVAQGGKGSMAGKRRQPGASSAGQPGKRRKSKARGSGTGTAGRQGCEGSNGEGPQHTAGDWGVDAAAASTIVQLRETGSLPAPLAKCTLVFEKQLQPNDVAKYHIHVPKQAVMEHWGEVRQEIELDVDDLAGNSYSWRLKPQANVTKYKYVLYGCNSFLQAWKLGKGATLQLFQKPDHAGYVASSVPAPPAAVKECDEGDADNQGVALAGPASHDLAAAAAEGAAANQAKEEGEETDVMEVVAPVTSALVEAAAAAARAAALPLVAAEVVDAAQALGASAPPEERDALWEQHGVPGAAGQEQAAGGAEAAALRAALLEAAAASGMEAAQLRAALQEAVQQEALSPPQQAAGPAAGIAEEGHAQMEPAQGARLAPIVAKVCQETEAQMEEGQQGGGSAAAAGAQQVPPWQEAAPPATDMAVAAVPAVS
ncbi:hypothetical protein N2152v2_010080 [Parachlorella kessleri]